MDRDEDYKVGGTVLASVGSSGYSRRRVWAKIERVSAAGVITVSYDGDRTSLIRPSKYGMRYRTIQRPTAHEVAMRDWQAGRPTLALCAYKRGWSGEGLVSVDVPDADLSDPAQVDKLVADLLRVQIWLATKPVDPSTVGSAEGEHLGDEEG